MLANSSTATIPLYSYTACLRCITFAAKAAKPSAPLPTCWSSRWGKQTHTSQDMSRLKRIPKDNFWWKHCFMQERLFQLASWFFQRRRWPLASADFLWVSRMWEAPTIRSNWCHGHLRLHGSCGCGFCRLSQWCNGKTAQEWPNCRCQNMFSVCIGGLPGWRDQSSIVEANWRLKWLTVFTCFRSSILSYGAVSLLFYYHCSLEAEDLAATSWVKPQSWSGQSSKGLVRCLEGADASTMTNYKWNTCISHLMEVLASSARTSLASWNTVWAWVPTWASGSREAKHHGCTVSTGIDMYRLIWNLCGIYVKWVTHLR